jgi:hypothetical protein
LENGRKEGLAQGYQGVQHVKATHETSVDAALVETDTWINHLNLLNEQRGANRDLSHLQRAP